MDAFATLDLAKVATTVLFVADAKNEPLDTWGQVILQTLISQGLTTQITAVLNIDSIAVKVNL